MTYEEFTKKRSDIQDEMLALKNKMAALEQEYINEQVEGLVGKKVRCYRVSTWDKSCEDKGIGYVAGGETIYGGFQYKINKVKKDGTMSGQSAGLWGINKVEVIED